MRTLAVILAALVGLFAAAQLFTRASPSRMATAMRHVGAYACFALALVLALRGGIAAAIPLVFLGIGLLSRGISLPGGFGWGRRSPGQASRVRTAVLSMELDHDTGRIDGDVLAGRHAGRRLSSLSLPELLDLYALCERAGDQSAALLEAFLDRAHPVWRGGQTGGERAREAPRGRPAAMTRVEAFEVLGLKPDAREEDIRAAHRRLMKQFHPDHGGSDYLAAKINQAKETLLGRR